MHNVFSKKISPHAQRTIRQARGFSLLEVIVGMVIFLIIGLSSYQAFGGLIDAIIASKAQLTAADLLLEQVEIVRNLPYTSVGEVGGIPNGVLAHSRSVTRGGLIYTVTTTVRNYDNPFDGTIGGVPSDPSPADYKLVQIDVQCTNCKSTKTLTFTTIQAPKALEGNTTNGALFIRALDANGTPVPQASVHILNSTVTPNIIIDDVTDDTGWLKIVDVPPGTNAYQITVTKAGYTTDKTYPPGGAGLTSPAKPNATVVVQQVTQLSFSIDVVGSINVSTVNLSCTALGSVPFKLIGAKTLGTTGSSPATTVYKYNQNLTTDANGLLTLSNMEWDTYSATPTGATYDLGGSIPVTPMSLSPSATQNLELILAPHTANSMLVSVSDSSTQLPIRDATVTLSKAGYSDTFQTGRGYLAQTDWSGGSGQVLFSSGANKYFSDSGNVNVTTTPGDVLMKKACSSTGSGSGGKYCTPGWLISSTFDMGGPVDYRNIFWAPATQNAGTGVDSVRLQIATNNDQLTWNFIGPDGTSGTYYTPSLTTINNVHDTDRYLRYKLYFQITTPTSSTATTDVSDVDFTYTAACAPPGQVLFPGIATGTYTLTVSKTGYTTYTNSSTSVVGGWQMKAVTLAP